MYNNNGYKSNNYHNNNMNRVPKRIYVGGIPDDVMKKNFITQVRNYFHYFFFFYIIKCCVS